MKIPKLAGSGEGYAVLVGVSALAFVGIWLFLRKQAADAAAAVANVNKGTPYEGTGAVGTVGNLANQVSGGLLAGIGEWIGGKLADATDDYDPNSPPPPKQVGQLPTSKQVVQDNFWDDISGIFTP